MKASSSKFIILVLLTLIGLLTLAPVVIGAELEQEDIANIKQAALDLVATDAKVKEAAIKTLDTYGAVAIPHFVTIMQMNQGENVFIGFELLTYAEQFDVNALPVIKQGLKDANHITRNRAAKAAFTLGPEATEVVNDIAKIVANNYELPNIRSQAIDALRAIDVLNSEVKQALALALAGDTMLAWKASQVIGRLKISYDDVLDILFEKLDSQDRAYGQHSLLTILARNIKSSSDPIALLKREFTKPNYVLGQNLYHFITISSQSLANRSQDLVELLFYLTETGSLVVKEQAIYVLGEMAQNDPTITNQLLAMIGNKDPQDDTYQYLALALEKVDSTDGEVISFFVKALLDKNSTDELRLTAARYLENSGIAAYPEMLSIFDRIDTLSEAVLWRLSPLFYHVAQEELVVIEKIKELTTKIQPSYVQDYANRLLLALGDESARSLETQVVIAPIEKVPAFPGAEGYGRYTIGGRGGDVYVVTNLENKGPGSLREAVEASGPRTVVFAVSGNIFLTEPLAISDPYITIAGQTAPGDGITITGAPVLVEADQVIIRYVRFRLGDYNNFESDAIEGRYVSDIMLDHISASWAVDETASFYVTDNLTLQWSFITESLRGSLHVKGNHGYGAIWGGASSYHHNLMAHHSSRVPRFDGERNLSDPAVDMRNNVIYNWGFNNAYGGEGGNHNIIANYYKPGPGTGRGMVNHRIVEISNGGQWFVTDNIVYGYPEISLDNWSGGVHPRVNKAEDVKHDTEFPVPYVITHTAEEAYELVLANAGTVLPVRDSVDQRIVEEVRSGTATYGGATTGLHSGIIDTQDDVGGLPFLRSFSAPLDSNNNGIPDWWLIKFGFNPFDEIDPSGDLDGDGYTNLEEYLNGTNPLVADN